MADESKASLDFENSLRLKASWAGKQSKAMYFSCNGGYKSVKDSLLLYGGAGEASTGSERPSTSYLSSRRRHVAGARQDYSTVGNENEAPNEDYLAASNFVKGRHPWYRVGLHGQWAFSPSQSSKSRPLTTNSEHIKDVLNNAAITIAKSQRTRESIEAQLDKLAVDDSSSSIPGAYDCPKSSLPKRIDIEGVLKEKVAANGNTENEPVRFVVCSVMIPVICKSFFFFFAQCAAAESSGYSFARTCETILSKPQANFTLCDLDCLIVHLAGLYIILKVVPAVTKRPWVIYKLCLEYSECCDFGQDFSAFSGKPSWKKLLKLRRKHRLQSTTLLYLSSINLFMVPILTLCGVYLGHLLTVSLTGPSDTITRSNSPYEALRLVICSPSQFIILGSVLLCQFFYDAFEELVVLVVKQNEEFVSDAETLLKSMERETTVIEASDSKRFQHAVLGSLDGASGWKNSRIVVEAPEGLSDKRAPITSFQDASNESETWTCTDGVKGQVLVPVASAESAIKTRKRRSYTGKLIEFAYTIILLHLFTARLFFNVALYCTLYCVSKLVNGRKS
ncbi:LAMI_0H03400g1_1 [Lachancea mirantina]|uniref:LAMI_0H03400g1_1 n=1 Tax=Lachancea mirantina TaxID=1230905 RepID=A0A1G4KED2_9SACH|nr:LAMI_0H03400g1_1 [Lachancea mirantina]